MIHGVILKLCIDENYIEIIENAVFYGKPPVKIVFFNKVNKYDISQIKQILYNSIFVNDINYLPEIIYKYLYAKAINKLAEFKYILY